MSSLSSTKDAFLGDYSATHSGVGIFFQLESDGRVYVKSIVDGSAQRDKTVQIGDVLLKVEDQSVAGSSLASLKSLILGPQGTFVKLSLARPEVDTVTHYSVRLMRGSAEYFASLDASFRRQGELDTLRLQLREATANGAQDHEELERVKKLLLMERESAQRREHDYEALQHEQHMELSRLQDTMRRAEQARREIELQLLPLSQREQDLSEELNRQREKDLLRKEYIEELKKRHDDEKARLAALVAREQRDRREDQILRLNVESQLEKSTSDLFRMREYDKTRKIRDADFEKRLEADRKRLSELLQNEEIIRMQLREVEARMALYQQEYFSSYSPYSRSGTTANNSMMINNNNTTANHINTNNNHHADEDTVFVT